MLLQYAVDLNGLSGDQRKAIESSLSGWAPPVAYPIETTDLVYRCFWSGSEEDLAKVLGISTDRLKPVP